VLERYVVSISFITFGAISNLHDPLIPSVVHEISK